MSSRHEDRLALGLQQLDLEPPVAGCLAGKGMHRLQRLTVLFSRVFFTFFFVSMNSRELRAMGSREPLADRACRAAVLF